MKRKLIQLTSALTANLILLLLFSVAMAGTIGNPTATVNQGSFQLGAEFDLVERDVEPEDNEDVEIESNRYVVKGIYGISDRFNIYAKLGVANAEFKIEDDDFDFKSDNEFTFGAGLKSIIYEQDELKIGLVVQISHFTTEDTVSEEEGTYYGHHYTYSEDIELTWWEYDVALGVSYEGLGSFVPYGGILFSKIDGESEYTGKAEAPSIGYSEEDSDKDDFEESDSFGVFVGADYNVIPHFNVGVEARLINETSFSVMLNYAF